MKKILFVIPSLKIGGTTTSLSILYKELFNEYNISVMSLAKCRNSDWVFDDCLLRQDILLSAYHEKPSDAKGLYFLYVLIIKILKRAFDFVGFDFQRYLYTKKTTAIEKKCNYDIVVAFEEGSPTLFVSYFNKRKIAWIHCNYAKYCPENKSELTYYNRYERIICVAKYTMDVFVNRYPSLEPKTEFIYNMINSERISNGAREPIDDARFVTDVKYVLISAGRLDPVKRFSQIPVIAKELHEAGIPFKWYILGPVASTNELRQLQENIKKYNTEAYVCWLGNKINPYNYFAASSLYVCTSESEACPMVFNEAMHLNIPVVSTDFGSASEFIKNGYDGIICPLEELSNKLLDLLQNSNRIDSLKSHINEVGSYNASIMVKIKELFK